MSYTRVILLLLACAFCPIPVTLCAQEIALDNFSGVGVRAMGMGGASIGVADDFSAVTRNPAGLALVKERSLYGTMSRTADKAEAIFFGSSTETQGSHIHPGSVGMIFPVPVYRGSLVFAGGYNRLKDFDLELTINGYSSVSQYQQHQELRDEGGLGVYSFAGAVDLSPSISFGVAMNVWKGTDEFSQETTSYDLHAMHGDTLRMTDTFTISDDYSGANLTLGLMIRGERWFRLGAMVATPVTLTIREILRGPINPEPGGFDFLRLEFRGGKPAEELAMQEFQDRYKLSLPFEFGAGTSIAVKSFLLGGDVSYIGWKETRYKRLPEAGPRVEDFPSRYKNTLRYHAGGELWVPGITLTLRGGFYHDPLPFVGPRGPGDPDPDLNPEIVITEDRNFITLGAGILLERVLQFDVAWVRGTSKQVEGTLTEKRTTTRLFASMGYKF